jgi:hypothetical protein
MGYSLGTHHRRRNHHFPMDGESHEKHRNLSGDKGQPNTSNYSVKFSKTPPSFIKPMTITDIERRIQFRQEIAAQKHIFMQKSSRSMTSKASASRKAESVVDIWERVRAREEIAIQKHISAIRASRPLCQDSQGIKLPKVSLIKLRDNAASTELSEEDTFEVISTSPK